jgi:Rho-binding antiterminator
MTNIISCAQYDYFEIACMHHYEVELTLNNGDLIIGKAHNVKVMKDGESRKEILELLLKNQEMFRVELITIHKMRALKDNPHFKVISLNQNT